MKKKTGNLLFIKIRDSLRKMLMLPRLGLVSGIVCLLSFAASVFIVVSNMDSGNEGPGDLRDFEVGKVADRDVVAERSLSYPDEAATLLRMDALAHLVPAVFRYSDDTVRDSVKNWNDFSDFSDTLVSEGTSAAVILAVQAAYPAHFSKETLAAYFDAGDREHFRTYGQEVLETLYRKGVFALNIPDLGNYNPDSAELLLSLGDRVERERIHYGDMITRGNISEAISQIAYSGEFPVDFRVLVPALLHPFVRENALFSQEDSAQRARDARERVAPIIKTIEKGERIIRRGFVVTEDEMKALQALGAALPRKDPRGVISLILIVALLYVLFILVQGKPVMGRDISDRESSLLFVLLFLYLAGTALVKNLIPASRDIPIALIFPGALMVMIPSVFFGYRFALVTALVLPLGAFLTGFFNIPSYIFALISGAVASAVLKDAEKRMDLIKAGIVIAVANCFAIIVIMLTRAGEFSHLPMMIFWASLNGIISGMLFLGVLPPLEHVLNAATTFRLIELSDLNAPILRKLFTTAPGTYSHSIMVANLAEQACQDIGANALLARVGAYYHDIGKMDNPGYFVENQTDHNKHDDIAPRLSATVIRSHVKLGVEKARSLGLPADVIDIIAEHHGNSLIAWFYDKATKQEEQVNSEDFAYPGSPPRSRESAVVMLADVTEAAVRTLVKPTVGKMEKFIQQLFDAKVEKGQLARSELTFRDLQTIKNAFVKVLAGYYHSRIEYPKAGTASDGEAKGAGTGGAVNGEDEE